MTKIKMTVGMVGMAMIGMGMLMAEEILPSLTIRQVVSPPAIDGKLDEACWKDAARIELGHTLGSTQAPPVKTIAWLGADTNWLYLAVRCEDKPGRKISAEQRGRRNLKAGEDDSLEIFLNRTGKGNQYYHFILGAGNASREQLVTGEHRGVNWSVPWRSATAVGDGYWTAEIAIPLFILPDKVAATPLTFNLTRNIPLRPDDSHIFTSAPGDRMLYLSWAPVQGYHDPERFGYLSGLEGRTVPVVFAPVAQAAENVGPYTEVDGRYAYTLKVTVGNQGNVAGKAGIVVEDRLPDGTTERHTNEVEVKRQALATPALVIPVAYPANRTIRVRVADDPDADDYWITAKGTETLTPLLAYPNLSYYSGEKEGRLTVATAFSDADFKARGLALEIDVRNPGGQSVLSKRYKETRDNGIRLEFPAGKWNPGVYPVAVNLRHAQGGLIASLALAIRIEPPPPAGETVTKVDHEQMCLLLNGQPFFPHGFFGSWIAAPGYNANQQWFVNAIGAELRGWRTVTAPDTWKPWGPAQDERLGQLLARDAEGIRKAHAAGIYTMSRAIAHVIWPAGFVYETKRDHDLLMAQLPRIIGTLKNEPGIMAWQGLDEIPEALIPLAREQADLIRKLDPYRILYTSVYGAVSPAHYQSYDVYAVHYYWGPDSTPNIHASMIQGSFATAKSVRRPIIASGQAQRLGYRRTLTPDEHRCGLYLTLIQGAKGVMLFANDGNMNDVVQRGLKYFARETEWLTPYLLREAPPQTVQCQVAEKPAPAVLPALPRPRTLFDPARPMPWGPGAENMPVMQALIHDKPEGGELILVANSGKSRADVNFILSSLGSDGRIRGFFDGAEIPVQDGRFAIAFEPYGVRVLETCGSARRAGDPVALGMSAVVEPAKPLPEIQAGKPGENLLPNSSFEQYTLPEMPDYWDGMNQGFKSAYLGQDATQAYDGRYSVRLHANFRNYWPVLLKLCRKNKDWVKWLDWTDGQKYTLSAYVKAEKTNSVFRFYLGDQYQAGPVVASNDVTLATTNWQRVAWTFAIPPPAEAGPWLSVGFNIVNFMSGGDIWVDALQLEIGDQATPYKPDAYRADPLNPKWLSDDVYRELDTRRRQPIHAPK